MELGKLVRHLSLVAALALCSSSARADGFFYCKSGTGGGVTNTGNAAAGDVASGKIFSSAALTNVAGTLIVPDAATGNAVAGDVLLGKTFSNAVSVGLTGTSTKNAIVPNDAPIQPAQAFVDFSRRLIDLFGNQDPFIIDFSNLGATGIQLETTNFAQLMWELAQHAHDNGVSGVTITYSGNALSTSDINAILNDAVNQGPVGVFAINLDLSGGTNAAPTGQGLTDKQTLTDSGWTVTTN